MAYYRIEPWGEQKADYRAGIIASAYINCHLRKGAEPRTPEDLFPNLRPPPSQRDRQLSERIKAAFSMFPKKVS